MNKFETYQQIKAANKVSKDWAEMLGKPYHGGGGGTGKDRLHDARSWRNEVGQPFTTSIPTAPKTTTPARLFDSDVGTGYSRR